jgi:hypothetical protein
VRFKICSRPIGVTRPVPWHSGQNRGRITSDQAQVSMPANFTACPCILQRRCINMISLRAPLDERRSTNMQYKLSMLAALALTALGAIAAVAVAGPRGEPGECGTYKYWRDGECTDARDRKSTKTWADEMLAKHWKP